MGFLKINFDDIFKDYFMFIKGVILRVKYVSVIKEKPFLILVT